MKRENDKDEYWTVEQYFQGHGMDLDKTNRSYSTNRRHFLKTTAMGVTGSMLAKGANTKPKKKDYTVCNYLKNVVVDRKLIDDFLNPKLPNFAAFDLELGYVPHNSYQKNGMDGAWTIYRYGEKYGERKAINFADKTCRVNTYGNSFTMCSQVSDGETWQEYLAAHLGEPIRNFGVGGYGVYQAYRRLLRTEKTDFGTPYVILNIWSTDDHYRSLDSWRWMRCLGFIPKTREALIFHNNPWDHIGFDLQTGKVIEKKNLCPTPQSLYNLCDFDFICETFKDDPALNMYLGRLGHYQVNTELLKKLAEALGLKLDFSSPKIRATSVKTLYWQCARRSTEWILEKIRELVTKQNKKFLLLLSYQGNLVLEACAGKPRADQDFIDYLDTAGIRYVDTLTKHVKDFKKFGLTPQQYISRYYIGHYSPTGNHFFAFAIKNDVVDWLIPKPPAYQKKGETMHFKGYLPS
ncbi:MAG: hypothetical protein ACYTBZ_09860 [Planctomycetota bacterium]